MIEPATNPRHRSVFHSEVFLIYILAMLIKSLINKEDINEEEILEITKRAILVGYGSHLIADSTTPAGLPFVY